MKESTEKGWLKGVLIILDTDNEVAEATIYKGNLTNKKLYDLVVRLQKMELTNLACILVLQVAGTRIVVQGTDSVSRCALDTGVGAGIPLLNFYL